MLTYLCEKMIKVQYMTEEIKRMLESVNDEDFDLGVSILLNTWDVEELAAKLVSLYGRQYFYQIADDGIIRRTKDSGLYAKLRSGGKRIKYDVSEMSLNKLHDIFLDLYSSSVHVSDPTRSIKITTNEAGMNMINDTIKRELNGNK